MKSFTRIVERRVVEKPPKKDIFSRIEQYAAFQIVNDMDINQCIASFGNPDKMSTAEAAELAAVIKRSAMESHWKHYAPRPDPEAFGLPPNPENPDLDSKPPRRHFFLCLNLPGITHTSTAAAIKFFANAVKTGLLPEGMALELDAPHIPHHEVQQFIVNSAIVNLFDAIAQGHRKALASNRSYHDFIIRFHGSTLNESCAQVFTDLLASGNFPERIEIRLPISQVENAALICFAYPEKTERYPYDLAIAFMKDKTPAGAINHKVTHYFSREENKPTPPTSPSPPSKSGLFAETAPPDTLSAEIKKIEDDLQSYALIYDLQRCHIKIF